MSDNTCYHCGLDCGKSPVTFNDKCFCCNGCKTVYEILNQNELSCYYDLEHTPGQVPKELEGKYKYLDTNEIVNQILEFDDGNIAVVELFIPAIHCSACIWVLEHLEKLNPNIVSSQVNFPNKKVRVNYRSKDTSLREVVELLASIAYEPYISLEDADKSVKKVDKTLIYQLGYAAFAFGNVMLLALPEYFEKNEFWLEEYKYMFRMMMLILSIPVVVYSAKDYFITAYKGLKKGILSVDVPIALGISVLFLRSAFDVLIDEGQVFFDSLTGLVFFLLLGKFFQQKTYNFLSFERDYRSYFPIAVTKLADGKEVNVPVQDVEKGDRLLIRNGELIPVDGILINGEGLLDYSFVTGESIPVPKANGEKVFAGGKQTGGAIEIDVINKISESYLTELWSNDVFNKSDDGRNIKSMTDKVSRYFTIVILSIALLAGGYWLFNDSTKAVEVFTAVLIVACPCALALSAPFAFGNMLRIFGYKKFYLKNDAVIEKINAINHIIFDKTGTITLSETNQMSYKGESLSGQELRSLKTLIRSSNHPLSRSLNESIDIEPYRASVDDFVEETGQGLSATINGLDIKVGSAKYVGSIDKNRQNTQVYISINGVVKGYYYMSNIYRKDVGKVFDTLGKSYKLSVISGDNEGERDFLTQILPQGSALLFNQKPQDKLDYIKTLQDQGQHVMMVGDGLNDAGALAQSDVGVAISENINVFSPACDAIMDAGLFDKLPKFLKLSHKTFSIVRWSFVLSFLYNVVGLYFAITAQLTPIVAAILMPLSSISIVVFVTLLTNFQSKRYF